MNKSIAVLQKKRGRPATGSDPLLNFRASPSLVKAIDRWAAAHGDDKPSRSEAIRQLLEAALNSASPTVDERIAHAEERASRPVPKERSPAKGMAQMRRGHAENEVRKLTARKAAKPEPASKDKPAASSGSKGNDVQDGKLTRRALIAKTGKGTKR